MANTAPANRKTVGKITFSGRNNVKHHTQCHQEVKGKEEKQRNETGSGEKNDKKRDAKFDQKKRRAEGGHQAEAGRQMSFNYIKNVHCSSAMALV